MIYVTSFRIFNILVALFLWTVVLPSLAQAVTTKNLGMSFENSVGGFPCFYLSDVTYFSAEGVLGLKFEPVIQTVATFPGFSYTPVLTETHWRSKALCKSEIYFATTWRQHSDGTSFVRDEASKVRGADGLNGTQASFKGFRIFVLPDTEVLQVDMAGVKGELSQRYFDIRQEAKAAIGSTVDWQTAWKRSESQLAESKASDKTLPLIQILSPTPNGGQVSRVDTYTIFIRGTVSDDVGVMNILVGGKKVGIKEDGTFAAKVKLKIGRNDILVQAEDVNNNIAEAMVTIVRDEFIPDQMLADVDLPPRTSMDNPDALAVVIGVESYQYVPDATFAYNDAEVFREYLAETLGMKRQRIKLATNSTATQAEFSKLLGPNGWLARNIVPSRSDVVVYFSGHGIASPDAKSSGLLPFDVDPNYSIGLPLEQLYADLSGMGARSVTVFLDACFTGQTRDEAMLIADARPIVVRPSAEVIPGNITVVSAASGSQISGALKDKEHGLFTYYLLKGIGGDADIDRDRSVTIGEINSFVSGKVKEQAASDGREQTPELQGDADRVLVRFQ